MGWVEIGEQEWTRWQQEKFGRSPLWLLKAASLTTLGNEPNSFSSRAKNTNVIFPPSHFKPAFCRLCFSFWFVTAVGHLQWADGMDICGEGGKKWALCSRTLEIWFWSITRQRVTEELGGRAAGGPYISCNRRCLTSVKLFALQALKWIGVGHFEGLWPLEKRKDKVILEHVIFCFHLKWT